MITTIPNFTREHSVRQPIYVGVYACLTLETAFKP